MPDVRDCFDPGIFQQSILCLISAYTHHSARCERLAPKTSTRRYGNLPSAWHNLIPHPGILFLNASGYTYTAQVWKASLQK